MNNFSFRNLIYSASKLISEKEENVKRQTPGQKSHQQEIENAILVLAAAVVRCDKVNSKETEKYIREFLNKQFGSERLNNGYKLMDHLVETGTEPFVKIACKELKMLTTPDSRLNIIGFLFGVAGADDFVNTRETRCIHRIAGYLGLSEKDFKESKQHFLSRNSPYRVLGTEEDAPFVQVKAAYRKMILKFHPDKRAAGVSENEAGSKFREIQRAFEAIKTQQNKQT